MSWFQDLLEEVCEFFFGDLCYDNEDDEDNRPYPTRYTRPPPAPGPSGGSRTTAKPDVVDPDPLWDSNRTIADCIPMGRDLFQKWCKEYGSNSPDQNLFGQMTCPPSTCIYQFTYDGPMDLNYTKVCPNDEVYKGHISMDEQKQRIFKDKCIADGPKKFPLYAIILICLCALAALITIGALIWNRRRQVQQMSQMSRLASNQSGVGAGRSGALSAIVTQRSRLPASRLVSVGGLSSDRSASVSRRPGAGSSFNRLTVSKLRSSPSNRLSTAMGSNSLSRSRSRSASSGRAKR